MPLAVSSHVSARTGVAGSGYIAHAAGQSPLVLQLLHIAQLATGHVKTQCRLDLVAVKRQQADKQICRVRDQSHRSRDRLQCRVERRKDRNGQISQRLQNLRRRREDASELIHDAGIHKRLADLLDKVRRVCECLCHVRRVLGGDLLRDGLLRFEEFLLRSVRCCERFDCLVIQHVAHLMRFVGVLFESFASYLNQRVQLLRRLGHEIHRQRVPLRLVVHVSERVNDVIKDRICAAEAPVCVLDLDAQCLKGSRRVLRAVLRLLHLVRDLLEGVLHAVVGDAEHVGGILPFLDFLHALAGHACERLDLFRVLSRLLGDAHQLFFDLDACRNQGSKTTDCRSCPGVNAVEGIQRLRRALGKLNAEFIRRAADRVAKTDRFALAVCEGFLEVGKDALCACSFLLRLCNGVLDLIHRLLEFRAARARLVELGVVLFQRVFHLIELGLGVVELGLPDSCLVGGLLYLLRHVLILFASGVECAGRLVEGLLCLLLNRLRLCDGLFEGVDALLLGLDFLAQNLALGAQRLHAVSILGELCGKQVHFGPEFFERFINAA